MIILMLSNSSTKCLFFLRLHNLQLSSHTPENGRVASQSHTHTAIQTAAVFLLSSCFFPHLLTLLLRLPFSSLSRLFFFHSLPLANPHRTRRNRFVSQLRLAFERSTVGSQINQTKRRLGHHRFFRLKTRSHRHPARNLRGARKIEEIGETGETGGGKEWKRG